MARQRRSCTDEFKREAVKLVTEKGCSVAEAARSLDIGETLREYPSPSPGGWAVTSH
jgi:transposase